MPGPLPGMDVNPQNNYSNLPFARTSRPNDWDQDRGPPNPMGMGSYGYSGIPGNPFIRGPRPDNWDSGSLKERNNRGRHFSGRGFRDRRF